MRQRLVLFIFFILNLSIYASPEYEILGKATSFPSPSYIGDSVEHSLSLRLREPAKLEAPTDLEQLNNSWIEVREIKVIPEDKNMKKYTVRIVYTPFFSGSFLLSDINLGGIVLKDVVLKTESSLEPGINTLSSIRGPMALPGTRFMTISLVLFLLIIPVFVLIFSGRIKKLFLYLERFFKGQRPIKKFFKDVSRLSDSYLSVSANDFYTVLLDHLRFFLGHLYEKDFISTTTSEILGILDSMKISMPIKEFLKKIFVDADRIKFGGMKISPEKKKQDAQELISVCNELILLKKRQDIEEIQNDVQLDGGKNGF
ncbi:MAG: hypothetical protein JXR63_04195 [Spirochaetales bacterium]|nr:hypothetical protein [Spirochaetales bacterium]